MNLHRLLFPDKSERMDDLFNAHAREQVFREEMSTKNQVLLAQNDALIKERDALVQQLDAIHDESTCEDDLKSQCSAHEWNLLKDQLMQADSAMLIVNRVLKGKRDMRSVRDPNRHVSVIQSAIVVASSVDHMRKHVLSHDKPPARPGCDQAKVPVLDNKGNTIAHASMGWRARRDKIK